ncbi:MAG: putative motility protein [Candidatus Cloacimonetes bacterium]|nr:putative motility protein [Candidatus Cloacimonadota bacterium]
MEAISSNSSLFVQQNVATKALKQSIDSQQSVLSLLETPPTASNAQGLGNHIDFKA